MKTANNITEMSAKELAESWKREDPETRYAYAQDGTSAAFWCDSRKRWVDIVGKLITGGWQGGIGGVLVNGKPLNHNKVFVEVE